MKVSELITQLQKFQAQAGDVEVIVNGEEIENVIWTADPEMNWRGRKLNPWYVMRLKHRIEISS